MAGPDKDSHDRIFGNFRDLSYGESETDAPPVVSYDERSTEALNEKIDSAKRDVQRLIKETETKLTEIKKQNKEQYREIKKDIENNKIRIVETLALFVALFTFLSLQ